MADKKFYWLKLNKDFFDRHEVKIIESVSKEYVLFYIKLLCESVSHDGELRFSEKVPYTREMLASVTNTSIDVLDGAMDLFLDLGLIEYEDDGTYFLTKVPSMIGSAASNDNAIRQQRYRDRQKALKNEDSNAMRNASVTQTVTNSNESIEYRDKSIENIGYINSIVYEEDVDRISASASASPIRELYPENCDEILTLWNDQSVTQNIMKFPIIGKRAENTRLCLQYVDSYDSFLDVIRNLDHQAWFRKQAETGKKLSYDWFCNPNNFIKIVEGNYQNEYGSSGAYEGWETVEL